MSGFTLSTSSVYTFAMAKFVYVQINGVEKPARIEADKVEKRTETKGNIKEEQFILMKADAQVGEFAPKAVVGWWIQDE